MILFEEHNDILDLFEKFSSLRTKEEQQESLELAEHASMVMNTLHNAISSLDNPDAFFSFVEQVGASHRRIPGFNKDYFWML
ncbi:Myoglobin [Orchesella cincta]|uniref:Myoglobin n=1 Tax=Orchesella cincta TaxID=48709 RepID=A0A1D2N3A0_ORCCI|nr:Myoglobin [Orchesella cincta]